MNAPTRDHDDAAQGSATTGRGRQADDPLDIPAPGWKDIAVRVKDQFRDDHVTLTSAGVAFFFFLALVPLVVAGVSIYGLFADPSDVTSLVARLGPSVPTAVRDLLAQQLDSIASAGSGALGIGVVVGIASALWSASSGFGHLIEGLNIAYDEDDNRSFWQRKLVAFGFTLGFLVLVFVVVTILSTATGAASGAAGVLAQIVGWLVVAVLFGLFLAIVYRYGPHRDEPEWSWVSPGSIFAVIAWTIMTVAFGFYVANFASYNETYGSLGAIVITLNWMYFTAVIVVVGAEITTEIERQTTQDSTEGVEQPMGRREATAADEVGESSAD